MRAIVSAMTLLAVLGGCRSVEDLTGNNPIVDTRGVNMALYEQDLAECRAYADQVDIARQAGSRVVSGAIVGSVFGAVLGNGDTAQRAAGAAAVVGGARGLGAGLQDRERVIRRCLSGRGYRVLN